MESNVLGIGVISAIGANVAETRRNLYAETPRLPALPRRIQTTLPLPVFEVEGVVPDETQPGGFTMQLLRIALEEALDNAGLTKETLKERKVGVVIGTTVACQLNNIPFYAELRAGHSPSPEPLQRYIDGNPAEWIRRNYGLNGPAVTVSNACSSGADAIGIAHLWLQQGKCDLVIAGGADELNKVPLDGFNALGVCSPEPCRPFDANRRGLNLGEAAGVLLLGNPPNTPSPSSLARPTPPTHPHWKIAGFGKTSDAFHITQPDPAGMGLERAIRDAVNMAGISLEEVAFINAHGTGTQANDAVESNVFARVFPQGIPFLSTKALTGHTLGAAGAIEAIFTLLMLEEQRVPRSVRFETAGTDMPATPLRAPLTLHNARYAISTSLAFGGSNSVLALHYNP